MGTLDTKISCLQCSPATNVAIKDLASHLDFHFYRKSATTLLDYTGARNVFARSHSGSAAELRSSLNRLNA